MPKTVGAKRSRPLAAASAPPSKPFLFQLQSFLETASPEEFDARVESGDITVCFEWPNLVMRASNDLFRHALVKYVGDDLCFDGALGAAINWYPHVEAFDGRPTRFGLLLEHLATRMGEIPRQVMVKCLYLVARDSMNRLALRKFLEALMDGLIRLRPATQSPIARVTVLMEAAHILMTIGNEFVSTYLSKKEQHRLRMLNKRGLLVQNGTVSFDLDALQCENELQRMVVRIDASIRALLASPMYNTGDDAQRGHLAVLSQ